MYPQGGKKYIALAFPPFFASAHLHFYIYVNFLRQYICFRESAWPPPTAWKTNVKIFFFPLSHLSLRQSVDACLIKTAKDLPGPVMIWHFSSSFSWQFQKKKISTWPLTSKCQTQSFLSSPAQRGAPFVHWLLNVESSRGSCIRKEIAQQGLWILNMRWFSLL